MAASYCRISPMSFSAAAIRLILEDQHLLVEGGLDGSGHLVTEAPLDGCGRLVPVAHREVDRRCAERNSERHRRWFRLHVLDGPYRRFEHLLGPIQVRVVGNADLD